MYKKVINLVTGAEALNVVQQVPTGKFIPFDPANTDYQEYLAWVAEGNTPLPADAPVP